MSTIADKIKEYIAKDGLLSGPGGLFSGKDLCALLDVMSGKADNFIVFNNGGGRPFHVWIFDNIRNKESTIEGFKEFAAHVRGYTYMRKIEGKEEIFSELPEGRYRDVWQDMAETLAALTKGGQGGD